MPSSDIVAEYVLPDYEVLKRGYMRRPGSSSGTTIAAAAAAAAAPPTEREEAFPLSNERFAPPELLFSPLDVGLQQSGLPDTIMQSLAQVPEALWQGLLGNIVVVGGNALLPGFVERLEKEVRMLAPAELEVRVARAEDPVGATWRGGKELAGREEWLGRMVVGREEYFEYGEGWVRRQFAGRRWPLKTGEEGTDM